MKNFILVVCSILTIQSLWSPAIAEAAHSATELDGSVSGKATLKVIGPLHLSEGIVILNNNDITVLSDATDPLREAELSGQLLHAHVIGDGPNRIIKGVAIFTSGYSITALTPSSTNELIKVGDGTIYLGHVLGISSGWLRIETSKGLKVIPTKDIVEVKSPRAFEFSIAANTTPSDTIAPSTPAAQNQISFNPTNAAAENNVPIALRASSVHKQLAESHTKRKLLTTALVITAAAACIAIPMGVACATPRPQPGN